MKTLLALSIFLIFSTSCLYSQTKSIKGKVISDRFDTAAFVSIKMNDTLYIGSTNLTGLFCLEIPDSVREIQFSSVGLDPTDIVLADSCNEFDVIMMESATYDFMTLKKVDRLRMKRFKRLPEIHKEAYVNGIFRTDKACYTQIFIPSNSEKAKLISKSQTHFSDFSRFRPWSFLINSKLL